MRPKLIALLLFSALAVSAAPPDLASLAKDHSWFTLRDALAASPKADLFYRGAVELAFNQPTAERDIRTSIQSAPHGAQVGPGRKLLARAFLRSGRYREALAELQEILAADPTADANVESLLATIAQSPDQAVVSASPGSLPIEFESGNMVAPLTVNGVAANYILDTGMAISTINEAEARRLGLIVRPIKTRLTGMSGLGTNGKVAVADTLALGNLHLVHVAFMVIPDGQPPFDDLPPGRRGILGISIFLALRTVRSTPARHTLDYGFASGPSDLAHANLGFDGEFPIVQAEFQHKTLDYCLDTGAQITDLYPAFAHAFGPWVAIAGKQQKETLTGIDGAATFDSTQVPAVKFQVAGHPLLLQPATILSQVRNGANASYAGNLGMDLFNQAKSITLDFGAMRLSLE